MPRGGGIDKKIRVMPDPVYNNFMVAKFTNRLMMHGKKTVAQRAVYGAFDILKEKGHDPIKIFETALDNIGPRVEVKARRIGGAAYQVPTEVRGERKNSLAIRWMLEAIKKRSNKEYKTLSAKIAAELLDASNNLGDAIRKKEIAHRMAEANKAFAHFRF